MGLLSGAVRSSGIATPEQWLVDWFKGGQSTPAGVNVDTETALGTSAFFAGIRVISEDVASLPLILYREDEQGGRSRASDHPLYPVLKEAPNELMTTMQLREALNGHLLTWGDGLAWVEWNRAGQVVELWPLRPDRTKIGVSYDNRRRPRRTYKYEDSVNGIGPVMLPPENVLHVAGLGFDGLRGYSLVALHRGALGLSKAMEHYGSSFFGNGARPGGVLTHPGNLSPDARDRMKADWEAMHRGLDNAQRVAILEEGVSYDKVGLPPEDSQFLEGRKFQVTEMARILRVPPHKIADLERATFSNIEDQGLDYLTSSLRVWLIRWEQAIALHLLTSGERGRVYAEHTVEDLLRGDIKTRYEAYATARQWGWMNGDDIRVKENQDPIPDGRGSAYLVPLNMQPAPTSGQSEPGGQQSGRSQRLAQAMRPRSVEGRRRIAQRFQPLWRDADHRLARMEQAEVDRLVRGHLDTRSPDTFATALQELFDDLQGRYRDRFAPIVETQSGEIAAEAAAEVGTDPDQFAERMTRFSAGYTASHVDYHIAAARQAILDRLEDDDPAQSVRDHLSEQVESRPDRTAKKESNQLSNASAYTVYGAAHLSQLTWVTFGENCPYCNQMAGMTQTIGTPFVSEGSTVQPEGTYKLTPSANILHPPLHPGCDCSVTPL